MVYNRASGTRSTRSMDISSLQIATYMILLCASSPVVHDCPLIEAFTSTWFWQRRIMRPPRILRYLTAIEPESQFPLQRLGGKLSGKDTESIHVISGCCRQCSQDHAPLLDRDSMPRELVIRRESRGMSRLGDLAVLGHFLERLTSSLAPADSEPFGVYENRQSPSGCRS